MMHLYSNYIVISFLLLSSVGSSNCITHHFEIYGGNAPDLLATWLSNNADHELPLAYAATFHIIVQVYNI